MKIMKVAMALTFFLVNLGIIYAKDPTIIDTKVCAVNPNADSSEKQVDQNPQKNSVEPAELLPKVEGKSRFNADNFSLSFSNEEQPDTTNFSFIESYLKNVAPLSKKAGYDTKSLEMIEVL